MKKSIAALLLSMFATPPAVAAGDGFFAGAYVGQASTDTYRLSSADTDYSVTEGYQVMTHAAIWVQHDDIGPVADTTGYSSQIDDYGAAVGFLPLNDPWSLVPTRSYANTGLGSQKKQSTSDLAANVGTAAHQFWPDRWAGKSRESSAFSLKIPHRHLQAAL